MNNFLEAIKKEKETSQEFGNIKDGSYKKWGMEKAGYLLMNMFVAVENIQRECGKNQSVLKNLGDVNDRVKGELLFIAAVCEELLEIS